MNLKATLLVVSIFIMMRVHAQVIPKAIEQQEQGSGKYPNEEEKRIHTDWSNLNRYKKDDIKLIDTINLGNRVVFMGNSITEHWINVEPDYFKTYKNYINRGISGQTTSQMLLRFRQDVIDLKPKVVVILGGTNDIAGNTGPATVDEIFGNLLSMYELAQANHIKLVIVSVLPAYNYYWKPDVKPADKIIALNIKLKAYADGYHIAYTDVHTAMADQRNGLPLTLSEDGVHPNRAGYLIMEKNIQTAINSILHTKNITPIY